MNPVDMSKAPVAHQMRHGWSNASKQHPGARLFNSGNSLMDFVTRMAAGSLLPPKELDRKYSILNTRRPALPTAADFTSHLNNQQLLQGPPVGLLARMAYMNPGLSPLTGAAASAVTDPKLLQQMDPKLTQWLRYL